MARLEFYASATRVASGIALAAGATYVVYSDSAGTVLANIAATSGGSPISGSTKAADANGVLTFWGPTDATPTLYLRCPAIPFGVQRIDALADTRLGAANVFTNTNTFTGVGTSVATHYFRQGPVIDARSYIFEQGAAPGVTAAADTAGINAAVDYAYSIGGGDVWLPPISGGYKIKRRTLGQQLGGGIRLRPRVNLRGRGTRLTLEDNCHFIWCVSALTAGSSPLSGTKSTITADTARGDYTVTVNATTGITVGAWAIVEIGQAAYDLFEPDWWMFAKVNAKTSTTITFDRPVNYALDVSSVSDTDQRAVTTITEFMDSNIIDGFELIDPLSGGSSAEGGILVAYAQSTTILNIVAEHPGSGVVNGYYAEGLTLDNIRVRKSIKQGGQASKGRVIGFAETRNAHVRNLYGTEFEGTFCHVEARSEGIVFDNVHIENTFGGRTNDSTNVLFGSVGNAKATVRGLQLTGNSAVLHTAGDKGWTFDDPVLQTDTQPQVPLAETLRGRLVLNLVDYEPPRRFSRTFRLPASSAIVVPLPSGLIRKLRIRVSTVTGITAALIGTGTAATSGSILGDLAAGQAKEITSGGATGIGAAYPASTLDAKELVLVTDGTTPAGAWGVVEAEIWVKPGVNDTSRGLHSPYDFVGVESLTSVGGAATDAATTQTLANNLRTALINLGVVQN